MVKDPGHFFFNYRMLRAIYVKATTNTCWMSLPLKVADWPVPLSNIVKVFWNYRYFLWRILSASKSLHFRSIKLLTTLHERRALTFLLFFVLECDVSLSWCCRNLFPSLHFYGIHDGRLSYQVSRLQVTTYKLPVLFCYCSNVNL